MRGFDIDERDEFEAITLRRDNWYNRQGSLLIDIGIRAPQVALSPLKPTHPASWAVKGVLLLVLYVAWIPFMFGCMVSGMILDAPVAMLADSYHDMQERGE